MSTGKVAQSAGAKADAKATKNTPLGVHLLAGGIAGMSEALVCHPLDTIKGVSLQAWKRGLTWRSADAAVQVGAKSGREAARVHRDGRADRSERVVLGPV